MQFVWFFLLDLIEARPGLCRKGGWEGGGGGGMQTCTLDCLSTSALLPCAETRTLWERAGSGSLYVQGTEGELRKQAMKSTNNLLNERNMPQ